MSFYIPKGQPCSPHVKAIVNAFESHLTLTMGQMEPELLRQFRLVTASLSRNKINFGHAFSCWIAILRGFDHDHPNHSLFYQFLNIPRGAYRMRTWRNPDTNELVLRISRTTLSNRVRTIQSAQRSLG